jgi:23S rRNA (adenine2030-N6)-methyltransferase
VNYRHAFHAGNPGDCLKHALLVWLLTALRAKPRPFFVLDTHAGAGRYDLDGPEAARTGEWRAGIGRLLENPPAPLADYVGLVQSLGPYPGSPVLIRALLRPDDRLACCELQPDAHAALRQVFAGDAAVAVHRRDGWEALRGLLPPAQRRGLVLIDPPYERDDDHERLAAGLLAAAARFPGGVFAAWYPIKHRAPVRDLHDRLRASGLRDVVAAEIFLRAPIDPARLNGCGMLVVRPPYRFEAAAAAILPALLARLGDDEPGAGTDFLRLADE